MLHIIPRLQKVGGITYLDTRCAMPGEVVWEKKCHDMNCLARSTILSSLF